MEIIKPTIKFFWRWVRRILFWGFIILNIAAFFHSRKILKYYADATEPVPLEELEGFDKAKAYFLGQKLPRPKVDRQPEDIGLPATEGKVEIFGGELGVWTAKHADERRAVALLVPGYRETRADMLEEGKFYHDRGFNVVLLDTFGTGDSDGSGHTFGIKEHENIGDAVEYIEEAFPRQKVLLHARGSGCGAAVHAVKFDMVRPIAMVLDSPYANMTGLVNAYYEDMDLPSFPMAQLTTFWGWVAGRANGFTMKPADMVRSISCPVLVISGKDSNTIPQSQTAKFFAALEEENGEQMGELLQNHVIEAACNQGIFKADAGTAESTIGSWLSLIQSENAPAAAPELDSVPAMRKIRNDSPSGSGPILNRLPHEINGSRFDSGSTSPTRSTGNLDNIPLYTP